MKIQNFKILKNEKIAKYVYKLVLEGNTSEITNPGQFVNILISSFYLRRPISICDYDKSSLTLIYKTVGKGTLALSEKKCGHSLDVLISLGNGFDISTAGNSTVLIGGGVGVPPLVNLAKRLIQSGKNIQVITGFNTKEDVFAEDMFNQLGITPIVTTVDGSYAMKGFVTDALKTLKSDYIYTCGPEPMLKSLSSLGIDGQFSFESRMACGFGACMGCSCKTKYGYKRICKEGPVLLKEEIVW